MDHHILFTAVLLGAVLITYHNSLHCGFVFDDMSAIRDNKDLRPETPVANLFWNDFWGTPMHKEQSHKSYRPLCVLTFRWNYAVGELDPVGYHLVNAVLHGIVCLILYWTVQLWVRPTTAFLASLLFAVHPVHTEAVTGVVGRAELLSSIFYLLALVTYSKSTGKDKSIVWGNLFLSVILVAVAMLCKEQGITVIAVCCVYELVIAQKMSVVDIVSALRNVILRPTSVPHWLKMAALRAGFLVVSTAVLLFARVRVMGAQLPVFTRFDNPAAAAASPARQLTFNYLFPVNAWLLLCPSWLCCDWTMGTIPLVESLTDVRNIATLFFYVVLIGLVMHCVKSKGKLSGNIIMCLALIVFPFIPATNLFFPVGFVVAERVLYTPSMGFCLLVAIGCETLHRNVNRYGRVLIVLAVTLLVLTHGIKTYHRNRDWESEYSIFMAGLKVNNNNAKLFNNVGHALENERRYTEALPYFQHAARVQPDDIGAHINVGRTFNSLMQYEESEQAYRTALSLLPPVKPGQSYTTRIAPNHLNVFINLGNLLSKNTSRLLEADALLRTAISMRADFVQAYINRGEIMMKLSRPLDALEQYQTALKYEDDNPDLYYNIGVVMLEQNRHKEALRNFEIALKLNPRHKQTLFNSAVLIQELGDVSLRPVAYERLLTLMQYEPDNEKIYFNLGMLAMDSKDFEDAKKWFDKAIQLKPDFRSALFNAALLVSNDMNQPLQSMPYLHQLLEYHPYHSKGLILLGDIYINHQRNLTAAEASFRKILEVEPDHVQANHNLCVVFVEQGDLVKGEQCLVKTLKLAPNEAYISQHLNIVRNRLAKLQKPVAEKVPKH